ncbi:MULTISPECIES: trehalose operon repressor [unclassified Clostridioides]|uniref:trehalose operon repressor n=1 Tax=unclassified Clostridioides TaxID=2635829 RepID=UPI001D0C8390|nr:trehalose operon repressor [Clostridioides sp. ES-S-0001-02]MCC0640698.1 trehalose operon repressor [Clostridioides sp. ES-S-0049-03]MCC0653239.1 trehalose operon repressor [Clostridioides sp. ES-S-0001-03]MCC0656753.1 trehalose operon repressor [Clostridioides sp. ES-S-0123-01]MCC0672143.1 trehalose operon repressor [Clostridioides sp. ES-S-0145-01]MCC0676132.1 trehalose operon repressor [Clostridioides sp. ES-W-0018-02]MCC0704088.1 trehalose operon repressor [Clostridioides sp. ES-S-0049
MKKFYEIYLDLEKDIRNNVYEVGELLPTEVKLAQKYRVSRETIRKAQSLLLEKGFIQKKQGKGAIVLDINKFEIEGSGLISFNELQKNKNLDTEISVLKNKKEIMPLEICKKLDIDTKTKIIAVERLRKINGEAVILDKDYFISEIIPEIPLTAVQSSIFNYIEKNLELKIGYANKEVTVAPVTEEDKILLDVGTDTHVVVIRSEVYLEDTRLFQYHESRHRVDTFRFVDFARRRNL